MNTLKNNNDEKRTALVTVVAVIGLVIFDLTPFITASSFAKLHGMTFSKLIMQSLEFAFYPSMAALFITGFILGFIQPKRWLLTGCSLILFLPVNAIIDITINPTSHNLLLFELIMYIVFFGVPAVAGAFLGGRVRTGETVWDHPK